MLMSGAGAGGEDAANLRIYLVLHDCHSVPVAKLLHWVQRLHVFQHLPVNQNIAFILQ